MWYLCVCPSPGGLWSVFTLGGAGSKAGVDQEHNPLPLSNQSLLLLLVLANLTDGPDWPNPYRQAITCFRNTQGNVNHHESFLPVGRVRGLFVYLKRTTWKGSNVMIMSASAPADTSSLSAEQPHSFQINFNSLYTALCEQQRSDQATLLLYTLLHQNANMKTYMLSRTDMDNLVGGVALKMVAARRCVHFYYPCLNGTFNN